jgi:hypothetical protein
LDVIDPHALAEARSLALLDEGEHARALRQSSPFAGAIDRRTRWRMHAEVRERLEAMR